MTRQIHSLIGEHGKLSLGLYPGNHFNRAWCPARIVRRAHGDTVSRFERNSEAAATFNLATQRAGLADHMSPLFRWNLDRLIDDGRRLRHIIVIRGFVYAVATFPSHYDLNH